jgi:hypothetical protein
MSTARRVALNPCLIVSGDPGSALDEQQPSSRGTWGDATRQDLPCNQYRPELPETLRDCMYGRKRYSPSPEARAAET